ncbi:2,3,4,5-tetrahydropyridine-2,6-dicarboxylate N-succinyltransferase [Candidatus Orientia mediorientalis]|uniref:2,3,4,5-tetrahydropyridine-2,6-dicarboxylate N-succinyltransferase n=1 Tax=Candidatus Orientia mediorientalis TaxID=911112 RepID=UPI0012EB74AE|nr:2,3,4,5-tetrahydropyridine-2,6-dicarboxylate N-succinyltransferase [Candidatus Orientia mediorientalis]
MYKYINKVEDFWQKRDKLVKGAEDYKVACRWLQSILDDIDNGIIKACEKEDGKWYNNEWVKKAILLYFKLHDSVFTSTQVTCYYDKIPLKFHPARSEQEQDNFKGLGIRVVPGAIIRKGAYIGCNTVIMPSFVNIGAYVGSGTMINSWATVGACVYVGDKCYVSSGVWLGGVLEPIQNISVVIEDNCFIGAGSQISEGVIVESGAVIGAGVCINASTKIVDLETGKITYGYIPSNSVVVSGSLPETSLSNLQLQCAVIIKKVDDNTRAKTSINDLLRC